MNDSFVDIIKKRLNIEVIRRSLIKYFYDKGFDKSFNLKVYPPAIQDIIDHVPELSGKIEIVPAADEIDPLTGYARVRWDLFALGNRRLFLGYTEHTNLNELARANASTPANGDKMISSRESTPRKIIAFICRVLENSESGIIRYAEEKPSTMKLSNPGTTFFRRGTPARFER